MAASKVLKDITHNLEEQLTCSLCLDVFIEPRSLPCLHSFCTNCIAKWFQRGGNPFNNELSCPLCKTMVVVPEGDPSKLPPSFYFDSLLQLLHAMKSKDQQNQAPNQPELPCCVKCEKTHVLVAFCAQCNGMICEACVNAHKLFTEVLDEHQPIMINQFKQENVNTFVKCQIICKFHEKKKLEYYCQTCAVCRCQKCATLDHKNHEIQSLEDAGQDSRKLIIAAMNRVEKCKENYEQELKQSMENVERIRREIDVAERDVDDAVKMICDMAKEHGRVTKNELSLTLQDLTTANDEEQRAIKTRLEESNEFVQQCQAILERDVPYEEIESKEMFLERGEMLSHAVSVLCGQSIKRDVTIRYSVTKQVMQSLLDIGRIVTKNPAQYTIELLETPRGFTNEFRIFTRNTEGKLCSTRIESIDVEIKDAEGKEVEKKVSENEPGKYRVSFQPQKSGLHKIQVKIGGEAIKNSPQNIDILDVKELFKPVKTFGREGSGRGQFRNPQAIAVSDNGEIAIADSDNHRIQIFSLDGEYKRHFGRQGKEEGCLDDPCEIVFKGDKIIVSDGPSGGRVQEFDLKGNFIKTICRPDENFFSHAICVNDEKNIAICCCGQTEQGKKSSIKIFSEQADFINELVMPPEKPLNITFGFGKYFVNYFSKHHVRVFDVNGVPLYMFGEEGKRDGQFNGASGLAVYGPDMILVCDAYNHRVQVFTHEGQFIRSFGSRGSGVGQMNSPSDVAVLADGRVYVLEYKGNRVSVWF